MARDATKSKFKAHGEMSPTRIVFVLWTNTELCYGDNYCVINQHRMLNGYFNV